MRMMDVYQGSILWEGKHDRRRYRHSPLYSLPSQIQNYAERTAIAIEGEEPKPQSREFTKSNVETRRCQLLFLTSTSTITPTNNLLCKYDRMDKSANMMDKSASRVATHPKPASRYPRVPESRIGRFIWAWRYVSSTRDTRVFSPAARDRGTRPYLPLAAYDPLSRTHMSSTDLAECGSTLPLRSTC